MLELDFDQVDSSMLSSALDGRKEKQSIPKLMGLTLQDVVSSELTFFYGCGLS